MAASGTATIADATTDLAAPPAPTLVSPIGVITTPTPAYVWNAVAGSTSYYLVVQNTAGVVISTNVDPSFAGCASGTGRCTYVPPLPMCPANLGSACTGPVLTGGSTYAWFVNASNAAGTSAWSAGNTFTVNGPVLPPPVPTPISPPAGMTSSMPTYSWNASTGAISYYLLVQNTDGVAVGTSVSAMEAGCGAGTGTCSYNPLVALVVGRTYSWFVNASNGAGTSGWSGTMMFTVQRIAQPTLRSPSGMADTITPTYRWDTTDGPFYLLVQGSAGVAISAPVSPACVGVPMPGIPAVCSITPSIALTQGATYDWFVWNPYGWSAPLNFTVASTPPNSPAAPVLLSPDGTIASSSLTLVWQASASATDYEVLIQNTSDVVADFPVTASSVGCVGGTGMCAATAGFALTSGVAYNWFVRARNVLGASPWSTPMTLKLATGAVPAAPLPISPRGALAGTSGITFTWQKVAGAERYIVLVQNTAGIAATVAVDPTAAGCAMGATCSANGVFTLAGGSTYNWFVKATNSAGESHWAGPLVITTP